MSAAERDKRRDESAILSKQAGLITGAQAADLGMSPGAISRRVKGGEWARVLPGVYRARAVPRSLRQRMVAAQLWAGTESTLSHGSAATIWQLDHEVTQHVELWMPSRAKSVSRLVIAHAGSIESIDRRVRAGLWVTSPARTLIDLAGRLTDEPLEAAVESAFRRGLTTPASLSRRLDAVGGKGRRGAGALRKLLADRGDAAALEHRLEVKVWRILKAAGLRPVRQLEVRDAGVTRRLDFAWPSSKVAVEANGFETHGGRLAIERDYERVAWFVARGWRVISVSWRQAVDRPERIVSDVLHALRRAAA